jgi:hypothetical protein
LEGTAHSGRVLYTTKGIGLEGRKGIGAVLGRQSGDTNRFYEADKNIMLFYSTNDVYYVRSKALHTSTVSIATGESEIRIAL